MRRAEEGFPGGAAECLRGVESLAAAYLDEVGGVGRNRCHVSELRRAVDAAVARRELQERCPDVRPGEAPGDDPVWSRPVAEGKVSKGGQRSSPVGARPSAPVGQGQRA